MNLQMIAETKNLKGNHHGTKRMKLLTTQEAADELGVTSARIRAMILSGRLPAEKFGHVHMIREEDLELVADRRPGRPPLTDEEKAERAERRAAEKIEPPASTIKPKVRAKKATRKAAKKKGGAAK